jgi:hypothetical protein
VRGGGGRGGRTALLSWSADTVLRASSASFTVWQTTSPSTVRSSGSMVNLRSPPAAASQVPPPHPYGGMTASGGAHRWCP